MKNHRHVCFAKEAGYAEYKGLPGKIQTGCPNTPDLKSRLCSKHRPTAVTPQCSQPTELQGEASASLGQSELARRQYGSLQYMRYCMCVVCNHRTPGSRGKTVFRFPHI